MKNLFSVDTNLSAILNLELPNQLILTIILKVSLILNIGGISNITCTVDWKDSECKNKILAYDIGPGNCLIDEWIRKNSKKKYDKDGFLASSGKTDKLIFNQALENFTENSSYKKSLDVNDFDVFFAKGLSLENGAATPAISLSSSVIENS